MDFFSIAATGLGCLALGYAFRSAVARGNVGTGSLKERFALVERAKREWEAIFDTVNELVLVVEDGQVRRVNNAFARLFGVHPRELIGHSLTDVFGGHSDAWLSEAQFSEIDDVGFKTVFEVTRVPIGRQLVMVARDVGPQRRLVTQLVQTDKMATVGMLAAGVAHEINNPAAYVTTNLSQLAAYIENYEGAYSELEQLVEKDPSQREFLVKLAERHDLTNVRVDARDLLSESKEGMERIRNIVSNLQSICRREQSQTADVPVQLDQIIEAVAKTASPHLKSWGGHLDVTSVEPTWVSGQRGQLMQVMLNLVVNGIQASDGERPNHVSVGIRQEKGWAVITVSDTGKGISTEYQKRIFEPFFTTKPEGLGTGLGLSITRDLISAHGGEIEVASELGKGTTVTVRLPVIAPDEDVDVIAPIVQGTASDRRLRLLIVDDEPNLLRSLERSLARQHEIHLAANGEAAMRELKLGSYDVVLCDLNMPGMNGLELHRRVTMLDKALASRFLFFTGQPISDSIAQHMNDSGVEALQKPLDLKALSARLIAKA